MASYRVSTNTNNSNKTTQGKKQKNRKQIIVIIISDKDNIFNMKILFMFHWYYGMARPQAAGIKETEMESSCEHTEQYSEGL
jgi:hypothetical protein